MPSESSRASNRSINQRSWPALLRTKFWLGVALAGVVGTAGVAAGQAPSASEACVGYSCDEQGAWRMLGDVAVDAGADTWTAGARAELELLLDNAVERMRQEGFTPENFVSARSHFQEFLAQVPMGVADTQARELERLNRGSHPMCPLWPFC